MFSFAMSQEKYRVHKNSLKPTKSLPLIMHVDMNGFFASCEQQENPFLRGKPVGVVPYLSGGSTIIAASYEAKSKGVSTGTKVYEAKKKCPNIILKLNDPPKYRYIHSKLMNVFKSFTPDVESKSIDEAVLSLWDTQINHVKESKDSNVASADIMGGSPIVSDQRRYELMTRNAKTNVEKGTREKHRENVKKLAGRIKKEVKNRVGEWFSCSVGVGTNRFLAKVASNVHKPDGFYYVDYNNLKTFYDMLSLEDLHGVGPKIKSRLNKIGIHTPNEFRSANLQILKHEFKSWGYYWFLRLNGYEIDDEKSKRRTVGHSYHIPYTVNNYGSQQVSKVETNHDASSRNIEQDKYEEYLEGVILKLVEKTCRRLRSMGLKARGFYFYCKYNDGTGFNKSKRVKVHTNNTKKIYSHIRKLFYDRDEKAKKIKNIAISTHKLTNKEPKQPSLFGNKEENESLYEALDEINDMYGDFTVVPSTLLKHKNTAPDRIAFGK